MRILLLTQWFDPEPTFKGLAFAKQLVADGHDVEVLTGFPNYPEGELYAGYHQKIWAREQIDGVSVIRVPLYPSHDGSSMRRSLNYMSFALSAALLGPLLVRGADVAYVYHAPGTMALPAIALRALRGIPFVYDINDLWPDSLPATGMLNNRALLTVIGWWCGIAYRAASHIVIGSPGAQSVLVARGVPAAKITTIFNWCDESTLLAGRGEHSEAELPADDRFNVVFAGNLGKAQALGAMLDAAELIAGSVPRVRLVFVGGGVEADQLRVEAAARSLRNVEFWPRRPMSAVGPILRWADALVVHLKDEPIFRITLPSKTQAYLAVGRPILMAVRGDAADLIDKSGGGITCVPQDPRSIADAITALAAMTKTELDRMGASGARYYWQELSLAAGARRYGAVFADVAAGKGS